MYTFNDARQELVDKHIVPRVRDKAVITAMLAVPRHLFVSSEQRRNAYVNDALPIGYGQTISQPSLVAQMTEALELDKSKSVLEIGTGSGYQAAILSFLSRYVTTVERIPELAYRAKRLLQKLKYTNTQVVVGDGKEGFAENAPYDAVLVTAGTTQIPRRLIQQLKEDGTMVIPFGKDMQELKLMVGTKKHGRMRWKARGWVSFVPLR